MNRLDGFTAKEKMETFFSAFDFHLHDKHITAEEALKKTANDYRDIYFQEEEKEDEENNSD